MVTHDSFIFSSLISSSCRCLSAASRSGAEIPHSPSSSSSASPPPDLPLTTDLVPRPTPLPLIKLPPSSTPNPSFWEPRLPSCGVLTVFFRGLPRPRFSPVPALPLRPETKLLDTLPVSERALGVAENGVAFDAGKDVWRSGCSFGRLALYEEPEVAEGGPSEGRFLGFGRAVSKGPVGELAIASELTAFWSVFL